MTNEELNKIHSIMKKVFLTSFVVYALFVFCVFYFFGNLLTTQQLVLIVIFGPMAIGLVVLFIAKVKNPPAIDESEVNFEDEIDADTTETED